MKLLKVNIYFFYKYRLKNRFKENVEIKKVKIFF